MLGKTITYAIIFSLGLLLGMCSAKEEENINMQFIIPEPISIPDSINYEEDLFFLLSKYKVQNILIVLAQAKLESGNFTSNLFTKYYNFVNMKVPGRRPTSGTRSDNHDYLEYKSLSHSVLDYALWQASYARGLTEEQYYSRLVELGFAEDTLYIHKLRPIVKQLKTKYGK